MNTAFTIEQAYELLKQYNKDPFHLRHGRTVEGVMRYFARELGYGQEENFWAVVGLLHDLDFEQYPQEHCIREQQLMQDAGLEPEVIHAAVSHGYGLCCDIKPEHTMEKVLFATDELSGLIGAAALMRSSKSTKDLELSSLKKKFKDKRFAAGCSRDVIRQGAEMLGWELDELMERTILAMREIEDGLNAEFAE